MFFKTTNEMIMNISTRNINLDEEMEDSIIEILGFIDEFSDKESSLSLIKTKNEFEIRVSFEVEGKCCTLKIKDVDLKKGLQKVKRKSYQKIISINRHKSSQDTIRKMKPVNEEPEVESDTSHIKINTIDKPMTEDDMKNIMIERKLNDALFVNIDAGECLSVIQRKKDKFKIYITDIKIF